MSVVQPQNPVADRCQPLQIVRHHDEGGAARAHLLYPRRAFQLELGIADAERFVDDEDVGVDAREQIAANASLTIMPAE